MRARIEITIKQLPVLVQSTSSDTRKKIAKRDKRMLKRRSKKITRVHNVFGVKGRTVCIVPMD
jgi:hypothetical protein